MATINKTIELKLPKRLLVKIERLNKAAKEMQEAIEDLKNDNPKLVIPKTTKDQRVQLNEGLK